MKILRIFLIALLILILMSVISGLIFIRYSSRKALPDYNKDLYLPFLADTVDVFRDSTGMPHVYAKNCGLSECTGSNMADGCFEKTHPGQTF